MTRSKHAWWAPYFFIFPFLLIFGTFVLYPLLQSAWLSTRFAAGPGLSRNVGLQNYQILGWHDPLFLQALANTVYFAAGSLVTQMPCALALALLLNRKDLRGRAIYRLIFFSPFLMGLVFVALLVGLMFAKKTGLVNVALHDLTSLVTFHKFVWDDEYAWYENMLRPMLVLCALWVYTGFNMVYFLAALQNVPAELVEAAQADGAGPWRRFWHVTLPAIRPVASYIALLSVLGSFQLFELPYILFANQSDINGPKNLGVTTVIDLYRTGFEGGNLGRACAMGWVLAIILMLFAIGYRVVGRREEA
jgi:ABC-type sugar transport system permease subunit